MEASAGNLVGQLQEAEGFVTVPHGGLHAFDSADGNKGSVVRVHINTAYVVEGGACHWGLHVQMHLSTAREYGAQHYRYRVSCTLSCILNEGHRA
jgi:hypothetical protein